MASSEILLEAGTNELEIIEFYIDRQGPDKERSYFGVNVAKVLEVIESPNLRRPSSAPHPCYLGTIPLREMILPVLDLAVWLDIDRLSTRTEIILVTQFNRKTTGFLASGVTQIHRVDWREVEPPHRCLAALPANCVTGIVKVEGRFVQLLDLEKIILELDPVPDSDLPPPDPGAGPVYRAMVVEDSGMMRHMIRERLLAGRFEVEVLQNGQEAWDRLLELAERGRTEGRPVSASVDIVISDIEMPLLDGYTLTRRIKEDPRLKDIPVVLFSSLITDELRHRGQAVGADGQISKPEFGNLAHLALSLIARRRDGTA